MSAAGPAPGSVDALKAAKAALSAGDLPGVCKVGADWAWAHDPPPGCSRCTNGNAWLRSLRTDGLTTPNRSMGQRKRAEQVIAMLRMATTGPARPLPDDLGPRRPFEWENRKGLGAVGFGGVDAGFPAALWAMYAQTGIRPEWIVPVLFAESGLNPAAVNSIGCVGINQACPFAVPTPADYTSWTASEQLTGVVTPMYQAITAKFGALRSGARVEQANFLPATLPTAKSLGSVLASQGSAVYAGNAGLDWQHKGTITVADLGHFVGKAAAVPYVQSVIGSAYGVAPAGVGAPTDPVLGTDFGSAAAAGMTPGRYVAALVGILGLGAALAYLARQHVLARRLASGW